MSIGFHLPLSCGLRGAVTQAWNLWAHPGDLFVYPLSILPLMCSADLTPQCGSGACLHSAIDAGLPHPQNLPLPLTDGTAKVTGLKNTPQQWSRGGTAMPLARPGGSKRYQPPCPIGAFRRFLHGWTMVVPACWQLWQSFGQECHRKFHLFNEES